MTGEIAWSVAIALRDEHGTAGAFTLISTAMVVVALVIGISGLVSALMSRPAQRQ